jgi:Icc-related predicted phosphoesterase
MIIDCISDLHGRYPEMEGGDLLLIAGDLIETDDFKHWEEFFSWLSNCDYTRKIFIAGNHDNSLFKIEQTEGKFPEIICMCLDLDNTSYLCDSGIEFQGLKIWGSPWTKTFPDINVMHSAFTLPSDNDLMEKWEKIPDETDILITHSPAYGIRDQDISYQKQTNLGSASLLRWIVRRRTTLKLHLCGHIHEGYGMYDVRNLQSKLKEPNTPVFVNGSHMNEYYDPVNPPIRIIL